MRIESWVGVTIVVVVTVGRLIAAEQQQGRLSLLPSNVAIPGDLAQTIARIHARSQTFRAQCDRIAAAE